MKPFRKTAIGVGILYIVGRVAGVLNVICTQAILSDPGFLAKVSGNEKSMSPFQTAANLPIFLQEMVMAVWLIVKGFNTLAIPSEKQI